MKKEEQGRMMKGIDLTQIKENYTLSGLTDFELFWNNPPVNTLFEVGLLHI